MKKQLISNTTVLDIREANKKLLDMGRTTHAPRYRELSNRFSLSEWIVRWICQGREYSNVGGFIERFDHEGGFNRAVSDNEALQVREHFDRDATVMSLAKKYGVSTVTIQRILLGKTYRNVGGPLFDKATLKKRMGNKSSVVINTVTVPSSKKFSVATVVHPKSVVQQPAQTAPIMSVSSTPNLSSIDVFLIRTGYSFGASIESLQIQFRLSRQTVVEIINGKMFPNLPGPKETALV